MAVPGLWVVETWPQHSLRVWSPCWRESISALHSVNSYKVPVSDHAPLGFSPCRGAACPFWSSSWEEVGKACRPFWACGVIWGWVKREQAFMWGSIDVPRSPGGSVSKEKPPRSEPRAKLKGSVDKPAGVGVGGKRGGAGSATKAPCALPKEHCLCYFPLGRHWETGRTVLDDPIIH